jgi:hypothetical protein
MPDHRKFNTSAVYHIRVKGSLDETWADWFDGFSITPQPGGETALTGPVRDQAALHGLLSKIRDLGLPLLLVKRIETEEAESSQGDGEGHPDTKHI